MRKRDGSVKADEEGGLAVQSALSGISSVYRVNNRGLILEKNCQQVEELPGEKKD